MMDPLADMYTRIRNASRVGKEVVDIPSSNMKKAIVDILKREGFLETYKVLEDNQRGFIRAKLKYTKNEKSGRKGVITNIKQISRPGLRRYVGVTEVPKVYGGLGVALISTSQGILTDDQCRQQKVGGELLCYIW